MGMLLFLAGLTTTWNKQGRGRRVNRLLLKKIHDVRSLLFGFYNRGVYSTIILKSSDTEKDDVIVRWKLIQKYLKKLDPEIVRDLLKA